MKIFVIGGKAKAGKSTFGEYLKEELKGTKKEVIGIQNGTALLIKENKKEIISSIKGNTIYKIKYEKKYEEKELYE